jgi:hypothetical protein
LIKAFPFKIKTIQTDNGTKFTYRFISETEKYPFERALADKGIGHKLILPRTPWHNCKVEHSHRNDQRHFYDWEKFSDVHEFNNKLISHLSLSNNKALRTLGWISPSQRLLPSLGQIIDKRRESTETF